MPEGDGRRIVVIMIHDREFEADRNVVNLLAILSQTDLRA